MTFLIDDLLIRPFVGFLEIIHDMAIRELYNLEDIQDELKENRLLFELGERSQEEYELRKSQLEAQLQEAQEAHEHLRGRARVIE